MALSSEVQHSSSHDVVISAALMTVFGISDQAAKGQPGSFKVLSQAEIERHLTLVMVHVEMPILIFAIILNNETMVHVQPLPLPGK